MFLTLVFLFRRRLRHLALDPIEERSPITGTDNHPPLSGELQNYAFAGNHAFDHLSEEPLVPGIERHLILQRRVPSDEVPVVNDERIIRPHLQCPHGSEPRHR